RVDPVLQREQGQVHARGRRGLRQRHDPVRAARPGVHLLRRRRAPGRLGGRPQGRRRQSLQVHDYWQGGVLMAGSNDLAAQLAKRPLHVQLGILAGVLAVLGVLYWQFFYSALAERQDQLTAERRKLAGDEKKLKQRQQEWKELLQRKANLDEELSKNRITL